MNSNNVFPRRQRNSNARIGWLRLCEMLLLSTFSRYHLAEAFIPTILSNGKGITSFGVHQHDTSLFNSLGDAFFGGNAMKTNSNDRDFVNAAAAVTQESCSLLGIKSVSVDYGLVRTGMAVTVGYDPKPLAILADLTSSQVCDEVVQACRRERAQQIVVGLPLHKNGTEAIQTNLTRVFANELAARVCQKLGPACPVYLWDERYTSKAAAAKFLNQDPTRNYYGELDAEAACIIVESYYKENGKNAELVQIPEELQKEYLVLWQEQKLREEEATKQALDERDDRLRWRKEAMERDRQQQAEAAANGEVSKKKKKKKKKKR